MDIKEIREKARLTDDEMASIMLKCEGTCRDARREINDAQLDKFLNTEIVPERECDVCNGTGKWSEFFCDDDGCPFCNSTGKALPITVEQAIRKAREG